MAVRPPRRLAGLPSARSVIAAGDAADMPGARQPVIGHKGRRAMRNILTAAAIAAGLVALWAALLPLAA
jgi:hypothetical protein